MGKERVHSEASVQQTNKSISMACCLERMAKTAEG